MQYYVLKNSYHVFDTTFSDLTQNVLSFDKAKDLTRHKPQIQKLIFGGEKGSQAKFKLQDISVRGGREHLQQNLNKESSHPWVKVDQAFRPLPPGQLRTL